MLLPVKEGGITPQGTFWCFAAVLMVSVVWVWFTIPETAGRSLESMHSLFELPWYKIGLSGNKYAEEQDAVINEKQEEMENTTGSARYVEKA
jgi:hypothetical protein